ncbi:hypothetical protein QYF36_018024 [Acer negundo]|nr:hypothetical protein QYF36_018024 [Acer negundo]
MPGCIEKKEKRQVEDAQGTQISKLDRLCLNRSRLGVDPYFSVSLMKNYLSFNSSKSNVRAQKEFASFEVVHLFRPTCSTPGVSICRKEARRRCSRHFFLIGCVQKKRQRGSIALQVASLNRRWIGGFDEDFPADLHWQTMVLFGSRPIC